MPNFRYQGLWSGIICGKYAGAESYLVTEYQRTQIDFLSDFDHSVSNWTPNNTKRDAGILPASRPLQHSRYVNAEISERTVEIRPLAKFFAG